VFRGFSRSRFQLVYLPYLLCITAFNNVNVEKQKNIKENKDMNGYTRDAYGFPGR